MNASNLELRHRKLLHQLLVAAAFVTYLYDPDDIVWRFVKNSSASHQWERALFLAASIAIFAGAVLCTWSRAHRKAESNSSIAPGSQVDGTQALGEILYAVRSTRGCATAAWWLRPATAPRAPNGRSLPSRSPGEGLLAWPAPSILDWKSFVRSAWEARGKRLGGGWPPAPEPRAGAVVVGGDCRRRRADGHSARRPAPPPGRPGHGSPRTALLICASDSARKARPRLAAGCGGLQQLARGL
jgi:hypothetical protein